MHAFHSVVVCALAPGTSGTHGALLAACFDSGAPGRLLCLTKVRRTWGLARLWAASGALECCLASGGIWRRGGGRWRAAVPQPAAGTPLAPGLLAWGLPWGRRGLWLGLCDACGDEVPRWNMRAPTDPLGACCLRVVLSLGLSERSVLADDA